MSTGLGMVAHNTAASTTITMNGNYTITANFAANTTTSYSLTVNAASGGAVTAPAFCVVVPAGVLIEPLLPALTVRE